MCQSFFNMPFWSCGGGLPTLLAALLVVGVALLIFRSSRRNGANGPGRYAGADRNHSLEILKVKFANREITEQEYLQMKEVLER